MKYNVFLRAITIAGIACGFGFQAGAAHAATEAKSDTLTVDHIIGLKTPRDIQVSPEGDWVAYVVARNDTEKDRGFRQIWMTSTDGKTTLPLTASYTNASMPRWNPDGTSLAFLGTRGSDKDAKSQVWLLNRMGGEAQQYTDVKHGVSGFSWSPDGTRMVLTIRDPEAEDAEKKTDSKSPKPVVIDRLQFKQDYVGYLDRRRSHLYLYDGDNEPLQITSGDYDDSDPQWSPDGTRIAFVSKRDNDPDANTNSDIWIVSADMGAVERPLTQLTTNKGSDASPAWSPDGKSIAYVTATDVEKFWYATRNLAVVDAEGGTPRILTADYDRMINNPTFAANGRSIYFTAADGGNYPLMKIATSGGVPEVLTKGDVSVRDFALADGGAIAVLLSSHDAPFDVNMVKGKKVTRITQLNDTLLDGVKLGKVERLKVAGWNGDMVESFVYYPHDYDASRAYPTIFFLHGGPVAQHDASFDVWGQLYAANGYIAVLPNPHGSNGYGEAFTYALNRQWGVPDFADVDAVADHLVAAGVSDGDRLGVGGWSYGGILTNYMITKSNRFKGAVSGASVVNHLANYGHDMYQNTWEAEFGFPWEKNDDLDAINIFTKLGNVTTPTLIMGGQIDWNVPIQNSEQMYQVLKRRGVDTQLVVYPGEHHGIRRPSFQIDRYNRYLGWFDQYVKDE
ncbi:S9 family peptidase [Kordiimonas aquimaris]|uniref:S9 family peptidase n=1 Tax=Kordiimonas aquimaris TaxID=707591 RepID=UPI0021CFCB7C|nr:S9 family peptidase [Kordiimonas aquimaris]